MTLHFLVHATNTGGFYALVDNILDEIPQEEVVTLFFDKMDSSANFSAFFEWMGTNDFKNLLNVLRVSGYSELSLVTRSRKGYVLN